MSATIAEETEAEARNLFKRSEVTQRRADSETVRKFQEDIERRLGPRIPKSQFDASEVQKVAELVDEYLERRKKMTTAPTDSRVAPAPPQGKRQHAYEQQENPQQKRTDSTSTLPGIYTLPSTDPEQNEEPPLNLTQNPQYLSGKLVSNLLALIQVILILIFAVFISYDDNTVSAISRAYIESQKPTQRPNYDNNFYNPNYNERPPPPPPPPGYERPNDQETRYGGGPYSQPVTTQPDQSQNLHQFYYFQGEGELS